MILKRKPVVDVVACCFSLTFLGTLVYCCYLITVELLKFSCMMSNNYMVQSINVYPHHIKKNICGSRAKYRDGRKDTAIKVYTINQESIYLLISNVPAVGGLDQLQALCDQYGNVSDFRPLDEYPAEDFTEVYLVKYDTLSHARIAKKQLDDKSFLGGILHCCYAPEFESITETRLKLQERRKYVAWKTNSGKKGSSSSTHSSQVSLGNSTHSSVSNHCSAQQEPVTYVWAGKEYTLLPPSTTNNETEVQTPSKPSLFVPRQCKSSSDSISYKTITNINYSQSTVESTSSKQESSYLNTISQVRSKIARVSVPNVRVSLKRKKRI